MLPHSRPASDDDGCVYYRCVCAGYVCYGRVRYGCVVTGVAGWGTLTVVSPLPDGIDPFAVAGTIMSSRVR